jgi:hypothetical protein
MPRLTLREHLGLGEPHAGSMPYGQETRGQATAGD